MDFLVKPCFFLFSLTLLLTGCNGSSNLPVAESPAPTPSSSATPASPTLNKPSDETAQAAAEDVLISASGIGAAQLGMTLGELKQKLGPDVEFSVQSPFIVDFDAIAVRKAGEVQYYILYLSGQTFTDGDPIQGLLTNNPKFQTAEQVGPKTPLKDAEQAYGKATLSYNTQNESREYARFANQPAGNISFSVGNGSTSPSGIYSSPNAEYNETQQFKDGAAIQSILVVCLTEDCVQPTNN